MSRIRAFLTILLPLLSLAATSPSLVQTPPVAAAPPPPPRLIGQIDGRGAYVDGMGYLAIPGQTMTVRLEAQTVAGGTDIADAGLSANVSVVESFDWTVEAGRLLDVSGDSLTFRCPETPGSCLLTAKYLQLVALKSERGEPKNVKREGAWTLRVFVQYPFDRDGNGTIDGYPIGIYPDENSPSAPLSVRQSAELYRPPEWFVQVYRSERDVKISPHFTIGQFVSPYLEPETDPVYVAIKPCLIDRLERLRDKLVTDDRPEPEIKVLRGFISPNEAQKLRRQGLAMVGHSRHQYGDAAAIIVDNDGDGRMDDLNNDGAVGLGDVDYLSRLVEDIERATNLPGGIGIHEGPTDPLLPDTPYLAIDCRGKTARWSSRAARRR